MHMKKFFGWIFLGGMTVVFFQQNMPLPRWQKTITRPPNILFAIADDQSFPMPLYMDKAHFVHRYLIELLPTASFLVMHLSLHHNAVLRGQLY